MELVCLHASIVLQVIIAFLWDLLVQLVHAQEDITVLHKQMHQRNSLVKLVIIALQEAAVKYFALIIIINHFQYKLLVFHALQDIIATMLILQLHNGL